MPGENANHLAAQAGGFEPQRQSNWEFEVELGSGEDREECEHCGGSGRRDCPECDGDGDYPCPECQ